MTISVVCAEVKMKKSAHAIVTIVLILSQLCLALTLESSPHIDTEVKERINHETLSTKDLAKSVMAKDGWSNILCEGKRSNQALDVAVVLVGKELHSSDISRKDVANAALTDLLKDAFLKSDSSMAYPYVSAKVKEGTLENSLVEEFEELCEHKLGVNNIIVSESCSVEDKGYAKLVDMHSVQEYVASKLKKDTEGQPDLLVFCHGGFNSLEKVEQLQSEGDVLSELTSSLDQSGAKYAVLYVSDPYDPIQLPSIGRLLAEASSGNGSLNSTLSHEVFQIKTSLLEAILVVLVLLIILIFGLCCMMGIDTPARFETLQESS